MSCNLQASHRRHDLLRLEGPVAVAKSDQLVSQTVVEVEQSAAVAMSDILSQLPTIVDNYKANFEPTQLAAYKSGLFQFMDSHLVEEVGRVGTSTLGKVYEGAQAKLIGELQVCQVSLYQTWSPLRLLPDLAPVTEWRISTNQSTCEVKY